MCLIDAEHAQFKKLQLHGPDGKVVENVRWVDTDTQLAGVFRKVDGKVVLRSLVPNGHQHMRDESSPFVVDVIDISHGYSLRRNKGDHSTVMVLDGDPIDKRLQQLRELVSAELDEEEWFEGMDTDRLLDTVQRVRAILQQRMVF